MRALPVAKAGPAHVATLKTYDPPLSSLEGRRFAGAERRAKNLLFPTEDGELVLHVHLMSAGRLRYLRPGEKQPKTPAFRLTFEDGGTLLLTEAGAKKRAKVGLYTPEGIEDELAHLGPEAYELGPERLGEILGSDSRRLHAFLRDQRLIAGIGRAWANEILNHAQLSPYALTTELSEDEVQRLSERPTPSSPAASNSASAARPTRRPIAYTTASGSRARAAARRSRASTSTSTRSTTARPARPRGGSSRTAASPGLLR